MASELARLVLQILAKAEMLNPGGSVKDRVALQVVQEALAEGTPQTGRPHHGGHRRLAHYFLCASMLYREIPSRKPFGVCKAVIDAAIHRQYETKSWGLGPPQSELSHCCCAPHRQHWRQPRCGGGGSRLPLQHRHAGRCGDREESAAVCARSQGRESAACVHHAPRPLCECGQKGALA